MVSTEIASTLRSSWAEQGSHYEYRVLTIDRLTSPTDAHRMLTDQAEYGQWELARTRAYSGGARRVWLRRKIIHVSRTW